MTTDSHDKTPVIDPADEAAIRDLYQQLMDGWNQGDGDAFAAVFTEEGDLVAFDGTHFEGREEIAPFHQRLFDKWIEGTRLVGQVENVRLLGPDIALVHATGSTVMRGNSEPSPERDSIITLVAVRQSSQWRFTTLHNTRIRPIGPTTFLLWRFSGLLWKIFYRFERTSLEYGSD